MTVETRHRKQGGFWQQHGVLTSLNLPRVTASPMLMPKDGI
jgi:hypothetical protein